MFHESSDRLRSWMARVDEALDDVLADPPVPGPVHPHRIPLRLKYERRGGSVPPRPSHCVCPIHQGGGMGQPDLMPVSSRDGA